MVGLLPRDGDAKDVRWYKGPSRNTLHFLNAVDGKGKVDMELPVSDTERSPSQVKRWSFDIKSRKKEEFTEEVVSTANGVLARMDDRFNSIPYKYCYVGNRDPKLPYDQARGANMGGRVTNCWQRVDVTSGKADTYYVGPVQSLQEACFVPRNAKAAEGDGYLVGVASNYAEMRSELVIVDAMQMEQGAIATVKLPFRLRSGTHGNWMPASDIPVQTLET